MSVLYFQVLVWFAYSVEPMGFSVDSKEPRLAQGSGVLHPRAV